MARRRSIRKKARANNLRDELDAMVERMQTPEILTAMEKAFNASPQELGQAAVKAARSRSRKKKNRH